MSFDIFGAIVGLMGGLAFFLFGMSLMGSSLKNLAGGKLQSLLEKLSSNVIKGVLLGTVVTAIIQSSSATSVMVVGFVNSGIMQLNQAIGVIMGANIGTTVTGWILSLSGVGDSGSAILSLLTPKVFAPIVCFAGAILVCFIKSKKKNQIGSIVLGFGILMFGMTQMSSSISGSTEIRNAIGEMITLFANNPFLAFMVGLVMTAVLQSSSASVGIVQAFALAGSISYPVIIPMVLGINIGASVPVLISGISTNKNGKRTSLIYLIYNIIGTIIFLIVYFIVDLITGGLPILQTEATVVGIAVVNTVIKLISTIVLLPNTKLLAKIAILLVPDKDNDKKKEKITDLLDELFLNNPSYALNVSHQVINEMALIDKDNVYLSTKLLKKYNSDDFDQIVKYEDETDIIEDKLGTYLLKLSKKNLSNIESGQVSKLLHSIGDFERISDYARNLGLTAKELSDKGIVFSDECQNDLNMLENAVKKIVDITVDSFLNSNYEDASLVEPLDDIISELCDKIKFGHIDRLKKGDCTIETGFVLNDILTCYERIAGHCSNIAVCLIRVRDDMYDTHKYLRKIKSNDENYKEIYNKFAAEYNF